MVIIIIIMIIILLISSHELGYQSELHSEKAH